jgi:Rad3-related DNA helicase
MIEKLKEYFAQRNLVPRSAQVEVLEKLAANWDKKYIIVSAPTGVGKTHLALSIANAVKNAYTLTATKQLQEQYVDTSSSIVTIYGKGNYQCNLDPLFTCDAAPCASDRKLFAQCMSSSSCEYYNQKRKALAAQNTLTNYMFFLYSIHCGMLQDVDETSWKKRDVLIIDEGHMIESSLISFAETELQISKLVNEFGICDMHYEWTDDKKHNNELINVILHNAVDKLAELKEKLDYLFEKSKSTSRKTIITEVKKINAKIYQLDKIVQVLKIYDKTKDIGWVQHTDFANNSLKLSPLYANFLFEEYLKETADKFVFLSATIINPQLFCKELGIDFDEACFIEVDSPFNPENGPIQPIPLCKMNFSEIQKNTKTIVEAVETILDAHKDQKGIIHTGNYQLTKAILQGVGKKYKDRLIGRDMYNSDKGINNQDLMKMHAGTSKPTVLVSPSMHTGVDLYDDLSRFQIIVKLPFLSLGDTRVKMKSDLDSDWYLNQMFLTLLQSSGRSIRSEKDWADTYILDSSFKYFYDRYKKQLPTWFKNRVSF